MRLPGGDPPVADLQLALLDLGSLHMAVPGDNVVQAITLPLQLTRLPRSKNALEGVFLHRGQVVPLLDLQRWLEPDAARPEAATRQVLILRAGDKLVAILIDALKGLVQVPADAVRRIHHDDDAQEVFHSVVQLPGQGRLISLLDPVRLAQLAQVWAAATDATGTAAWSGQALKTGDATQGGQAQTGTCVVVRLGDTLLALPATAVGEIVGGAEVQKMAGLGSGFLGMSRWRNRDLPVLDMTRLLGLPDAPQRSAPWLLVLHLQERVLGFHVGEILAVRSFDLASVQRSSVLSVAMQAYCQTSCPTPEGERVYLLDEQALLDASPLSQVKHQATAGRTDVSLRLGHESRSTTGALLVFRSRQLWAAPMDQMREIVKLPPGLQAAPDGGSARRGSMEWRGQSLELLDLRTLRDAGLSVLSDDARVIVTEAGQHTVALLVENVVALIPEHSGTRARFSANGKSVEMVTVGSGTGQLSYQLMHLGHLIANALLPQASKV